MTLVLTLGAWLVGPTTAHAQAGHESDVPCHAADLRSTEPVMERNFPDAFVLCAGGKFYAYATNSPGYNVPFARSQDLKSWFFEGEAMPNAPAWAVSDEDKRDLWAPEVIKLGERYALYFSARHQVVRTPNGDPRESSLGSSDIGNAGGAAPPCTTPTRDKRLQRFSAARIRAVEEPCLAATVASLRQVGGEINSRRQSLRSVSPG